MLVTENLDILGAGHNRKITSHVLKSISFQLVLQGLGKEGENKTMLKKIGKHLKEDFFWYGEKKLKQ